MAVLHHLPPGIVHQAVERRRVRATVDHRRPHAQVDILQRDEGCHLANDQKVVLAARVCGMMTAHWIVGILCGENCVGSRSENGFTGRQRPMSIVYCHQGAAPVRSDIAVRLLCSRPRQ